MSFIDIGTEVKDIQEPQPVVEGKYLVVIDDAKMGRNSCMSIRCHIEGEPTAKLLFHQLALPKADDEDAKRATKLQFLKRFLDKFKVPTTGTGFNEEDFIGCSAEVNLKVEEYEGIPSNKIKL